MATPATAPSPFSLAGDPAERGTIRSGMAAAADRLLGLATLARLYADRPDGDFIESALARLSIGVDVDAVSLDAVPASGPVIVVVNHPTGAVDGLAVLHALRRRRRDVKVLGTNLLARIPEMRRYTIAVDVYGSGTGANAGAMRAARRWLDEGGVLVVFPAGAVASVRQRGGRVVDSPWQPGAVVLAEWTGAPVLPAFVSGQPGRMLRLAGAVHPLLRSALLPRDLLWRQGTDVNVRFGALCQASRLARLPDRRARLAYLRARTYSLSPSRRPGGRLRRRARPRTVEPIAPAADAAAVRRDIAALAPACLLLQSGAYSVYCASAAALPYALLEIGRLRELTFRAAGEGTGRSIDLDRFDTEYLHLFVWHRERGEIAGAYRVGRTDELMARGGVHALYSRTLFRFGARLMRELGPSLELGRSFVRAEYQRESAVLSLLWRGIGALVGRDRRYRRLFGPVSISADYSLMSRQLMAQFLAADRLAPNLSRLVSARRPLPPEADAAALIETRAVNGLADVERLVEEMETSRGLPVLVRQYLKLNARMLGFSVDPAFGDALDGLLVVDLMDVPEARLIRYLGRDSAARLRADHRPSGGGAAGSLSDPLMA